MCKLDELCIHVNDIIENRIEKNLKEISNLILIVFPTDNIQISLDHFVKMQDTHIDQNQCFLMSKNEEIERAVDDLNEIVNNYHLDSESKDNDSSEYLVDEAKKLKKYYFWYLYQALLNAT